MYWLANNKRRNLNLLQTKVFQLECCEEELIQAERRGDTMDEKRLKKKIKQLKIKNK